MTALRTIQPSFAAGEVSPALYGRVDIAKYQVGLRTCKNFIVRTHGGVVNRPGQQFIHWVQDSTKQGRMIPFEFSTTQTYMLEFGNATLRVIQDGAMVLETPAVTIADTDEANPLNVHAVGHAYSTGDEVFISGVAEAEPVNGKYYTVTFVDVDNFTIADALTGTAVDGTGFGVGAGGTSERVFTLATPYADTDLAEIYYTQSADIMTLVHPNFAPRELRRTAHDEWAISTIIFEPLIDAPTNLTVTESSGDFTYHVTAISLETGEESEPATITSDHLSDEAQLLEWSGVPNAAFYNIYRDAGTNFRLPGFLGRSAQLWENGFDIQTASQANPVALAVLGHDFINGQQVFVQDVLYQTGINDSYFDISNVVAGISFTLDGEDGTDGRLAGEGGKVTLAITSSTAANPPVVTCTAHGFSDGDTVYIDRVVTQTELNGKYFTVDNEDGADTFELKNIDGTGHTGAGTDGIVQRVHGKFQEPLGGITPEWSASPPVLHNPFGADGSDRCPSTVAYYEQRLCMAATDRDPQQLWMSQSAAFHNHNTSLPSLATDAISFRIAARKANAIRHLLPMRDLILLTSGGEWRANGGDSIEMTPTSVTVRQQTEHGAGSPPPVVIGNTALYYQDRGPTVRDIAYRFDDDSYTGNELSILSQHLLVGNTISEWAWAQSPFGVIWSVRSDGKMLGLTYQREHQVWGWHRHETDGLYESVASVQEGAEDAVYMIVNRTIDGNTRRYIERFHSRSFTDVRDAFFVDSGLSLDVPLTISNVAVATSAAKTIISTDTTNPVEVTVTGHAYETGDEVVIDGVAGMSEINARTFTITDTGSNTFTLNFEDGTGYDAGTGGTADLVDPPVVTVTAHGLDHNGRVDITDVVGMTELNDHQYTVKLVLSAAKTITGVTQAHPAEVTTSGAHGYNTGDRIYIDALVDEMTELNGRTFTIVDTAATTFTLNNEDSTGYDAYAGSGGSAQFSDPDDFELADPQTGKDIAGTDFTAYASGGIARKAVLTITGLDHLEGESLSILANGHVHPPEVVSSGAITLDYYASRVHAGMPYSSDIETLDLEVATQEGTLQGRRQKVRDLTIRLTDSRGGYSGPDEDNLIEAPWRQNEDYDQPIALLTDDKRMPMKQKWGRNARVFIRQLDPLPMAIGAIIPETNVGDQL